MAILFGALSLSSAIGCYSMAARWNPFKPTAELAKPEPTQSERSLQGPLSAPEMAFRLSVAQPGDYELKVYDGGKRYIFDRVR